MSELCCGCGCVVAVLWLYCVVCCDSVVVMLWLLLGSKGLKCCRCVEGVKWLSCDGVTFR
jgi:hypothetical protein